MSNWKVPLADISLGTEEIESVTKVLQSKWLSMGPITQDFEQSFAEYIDVKYAFAVTNCTAALHLAHLALDAGPGDTVICPSLTFVATANAIRYTGATPVFADISSKTELNISPDDISAKIDSKTKGICVVHYGGYPCAMDQIMDIAHKHNLYVVEDVAHAPGAGDAFQNFCTPAHKEQNRAVFKRCGSIGDIGCFSFFSNKNITTAEGGMITTDNAKLADKIRALRSHGMTSLTWDRDRGHSFSYDVVTLGYNYRIDEIRSALGLAQFQNLDENNNRRRHLAGVYNELLSDVGEISIPFNNSTSTSSHHIFPIVLNKYGRNDFMEFMKNRGIQTSIHYPLIHRFSHYKDPDIKVNLPVSESIEEKIVTLPMYPQMTPSQIQYTVSAVKDWLVRVKN